jgi:hypothetical protein
MLFQDPIYLKMMLIQFFTNMYVVDKNLAILSGIERQSISASDWPWEWN